MHDVADESREAAELLDEIYELKREIARLNQRVAELDQLAHEDPLVPLSNRRGLVRALEGVIARHHRHGTNSAVLFVDLNGLKRLNDRFGHAGGDAALIHVAERLRAGTRANDCVARMGGDEFCVLLDHVSEQQAIETAERLVDDIAGDDFFYKGDPMPLSVAIGVTAIEAGDTIETVIARADREMYRCKDVA
jgi:diguanylate cyclase (GGDEF)-like protein